MDSVQKDRYIEQREIFKMLKVENVVFPSGEQLEAVIRGMRNPMNSWNKSDSDWEVGNWCDSEFMLGDADMNLMNRLFKGGTEHRKYLRMIPVYMDITAPLYWWKEFDTYKIGTVANSCSTMHKIHEKEFTLEDFSCEHLNRIGTSTLWETIDILNTARTLYLKGGRYRGEHYDAKDKQVWWQMIQLLPSSYNQKRTVMMNYEVCARIIDQRSNHKLDEWHTLIDELKQLPYMNAIMKFDD